MVRFVACCLVSDATVVYHPLQSRYKNERITVYVIVIIEILAI
jgi:hypothetical protein